MPDGLEAAVQGSALVLSWQPASDAQTAMPGLTYNVRVGTEPGAADIVAPMSLADGRRLLPASGNAGHGLRYLLRDLLPGTYYWSVQAVDASYAGSSFAPEQSFTIGSGQIFPVLLPSPDSERK